MILKAFAIYDLKSLSHNTPFFMPTNGAAIRAFGDLVKNSESSIFKHPTDYILFEIGTYDDGSAVMTALAVPVKLGLGSDFVDVPGKGTTH